MQAWIVEWLDLLNSNNNEAADSIVRAAMGKDSGSSQGVLPKKYLDFSDMFDKA